MGRNTESSLRERADRREHMLEICKARVPAKDPVFVIAAFARSGPDGGDASLKPSESA